MLEVDGRSNELPLATALVHLADTTAPEFTPIGLLQSLVDEMVRLLTVGAAGVYALESDGYLLKMATAHRTLDAAAGVELVFDQLATDGPTKECVAQRTLVTRVRTHATSPLANASERASVRAIHALPMHLRHDVVGCVALVELDEPRVSLEDVAVAAVLTEMAAISLLQYRTTTTSSALNEQLTTALESRVIIEQAKGILAERHGVGVEEAFDLLRNHARNRNLRLRDLAADVVRGTVTVLDRRTP